MSEISFSGLNLKPELIKSVEALGFENPTPIQEKAIPLLLDGRDVLGQAQTGTGKTAAFGLPMLNNIVPGAGVQGLILCPTRELAVQVATELTNLSKYIKIKILPVYGGQSIDHQIRSLRNRPEIIVGTPGRMLDHLERKTIRLDQIRIVVLDEADEMLDMGFLEDIHSILKNCPDQRQTLLFSATIPPAIRNLAKSFMNNPEIVTVKTSEMTVPQIVQNYFEVNPKVKVETLCRILDVENPPVAIVFCRTKRGADELVNNLIIRGYAAEALHGDLSQRERDNVMSRFRQGSVEILIATDVAARGLDISHVTHVINYDIPEDPDSYVHRIGRTGRAGREGMAITLVSPREIKQLRFIERCINKKIMRRALPTLEEAIERRQQQLVDRITKEINEPLGEFKSLASELLDNYDSTDLLAAALKLLSQEGRELEKANLTNIDPDIVKVQLPVGRMQGVRVVELLNRITTGTALRRKDIGNIAIFDKKTIVEVPLEWADQVRSLFKETGRKNPGKVWHRRNEKRPTKTFW